MKVLGRTWCSSAKRENIAFLIHLLRGLTRVKYTTNKSHPCHSIVSLTRNNTIRMLRKYLTRASRSNTGTLEMPTPTSARSIENRVMRFLRSTINTTKTLTRLALSATKLQKRIQYKSGMTMTMTSSPSLSEKYRMTVHMSSSKPKNITTVKKELAEKIKRELKDVPDENRIIVCIDQDCFYVRSILLKFTSLP